MLSKQARSILAQALGDAKVANEIADAIDAKNSSPVAETIVQKVEAPVISQPVKVEAKTSKKVSTEKAEEEAN